jgi:hypothetical protein
MLSVSVLLFCVAAVALGSDNPCVVSFQDPEDGKIYNYDIACFAVPSTQKQEFIVGTEKGQAWTGAFFFFFSFSLFFFCLLCPSLAHFPFSLSVPECLWQCSVSWMCGSDSGLSERWNGQICLHGTEHGRFSLL